jgi:hypothetical protein
MINSDGLQGRRPRGGKPRGGANSKPQGLKKKAITKVHEGLNFSDEVINEIANSLPVPLTKRHSELLPRILREWTCTDLREHLSMDSRAIIQARIKKLESVSKRARLLLEALNETDKLDQAVIISQMAHAVEHTLETASRAEYATLTARLDEETTFLTKLASIKPKDVWNLKAGQPRNLAAYLVLKDAAAIFEWFTGLKATREVDRDTLKDIGPFWRFASALWPVLFGKGITGLSSAFKNWAHDSVQFGERSALIANINMRHPTWGVFES